jgi:hypothetical protein
METLGKLSERFESNGDPGAIGFDTVGGFSYGMYQIAANPGTLDNFLGFLTSEHQDLARSLQNAGGSAAGRAGSAAFKNAWKELARTGAADFARAQHDFIEKTHFAVQARKLLENLSLDVRERSHALREVVWSMAVQHGNVTQKIFRTALAGRDPSTVSDADLIRALYRERSDVGKHFATSTEAVKKAVKARFEREERDALALLASEQPSPAPVRE